jgi:hypothetical protein
LKSSHHPSPSSFDHLVHITLETSHSHQSPRTAVGDEVVAELSEWINSAKPKWTSFFDKAMLIADVPRCPGYFAAFTREDTTLLVNLVHEVRGPCVTFGVAIGGKDGQVLWKMLGGGGLQPNAPWCAVRFELNLIVTMMLCPSDMVWFADFERCVAWAWIEMNFRKM